MKFLFVILSAFNLFTGCKNSESKNPFDSNAPKPIPTVSRVASLGIVGDTTDVSRTTKSGVVIMGGSTDVDEAFKWMIQRSGGGDVVVIRSTGTNAYNPYIKGLGDVNSVETLKIDSRSLANDPKVVDVIRKAEMLFIAGGDQFDYVNYWKGTKVMDAINYLLTEKKVPVGGTSAGAAILGNYYFGANNGGLDSPEALSNPYHVKVSIGRDDFLKAPFLSNVVTDQHFSQRNREGRMAVFLGRIMNDWSKTPYGIAVDEKTAVCIDDQGIATTLGSNNAFFLKTNSINQPETFSTGNLVTWNNLGKAIEVNVISGTVSNNQFNVASFVPVDNTGWTKGWWYVVSGNLIKNNL